MLSEWGYLYFMFGLHLGYAELDLETYRKANTGLRKSRDVQIEPNNPIISALKGQLETISKLEKLPELGALPAAIVHLRVKIVAASQPNRLRAPTLYVEELLEQITRIKNDFIYVLDHRLFYAVPHDLTEFYGQAALFGEAVAKKFPAASNDLEWAGNCLALGQPTACVMHLNRAMEIALHRLAKKLGVPVDAKDNMGSILGKMTEPIKLMPDKKPAQKRRKEMWAECRTNLYHVKMAWRDPAHHGKRNYDDKQARDIMERVSGFMSQLATLL